MYLLTFLSQNWTRSYRITGTHTHTCVMHNALCCSRFSVVIPPLHTQSVPGYQTWQCQLGSWQQPSREEEKETESKREREMETQQDNVKKGCRGGSCGRHGLQHSSVCSVPHWSKTCCRTVPVGFFLGRKAALGWAVFSLYKDSCQHRSVCHFQTLHSSLTHSKQLTAPVNLASVDRVEREREREREGEKQYLSVSLWANHHVCSRKCENWRKSVCVAVHLSGKVCLFKPACEL